MQKPVSVGFIGLGNMGEPMAASIAKAGYRPVVFDVRSEPMERLAELGAQPAGSIAEVVERSDIVATCVLYDHQVRDIFLGPGGILASGRPGQVVIIHSTIQPGTVMQIAEEAKAKDIAIIDAPVSGGGHREGSSSLEGTLTLMVGAEDWAYEAARPILECVGKHVFLVGQPGTGQIVKLGNNILSLCNQIVHMEAIRFVEAFGVSRETLDAVARTCTGTSWALENYEHFDRYDLEHTLAGSPELPHRLGKDLRYAIQVAQDAQTYLPTVALCSQLLPGLFEERWAKNARARAEAGEPASAKDPGSR